MKHYRIADIRAANIAAGRYFFERKTMEHFHDRVSNWGVRHIGGRVFIHNQERQIREFFPSTGHISRPIINVTPPGWDRDIVDCVATSHTVSKE